MENVMYAGTEIQIFIHYPGQLIPSLTNSRFTSSFTDYQRNKLLSFKMSQSTLIKRRADYREPCNSEIQDYDTHLISAIINITECIPPYWKELAKGNPTWELCTSQRQLQMAYAELRNWTNVIKSHDRPCIDMYNIVGWNWLDVEGTKKSDEIQIKFYYQEHFYQELEYLPDFDFETFISNIGGFVGIFLGYSMMQFPDLIAVAFSWIRRSVANLANYITKHLERDKVQNLPGPDLENTLQIAPFNLIAEGKNEMRKSITCASESKPVAGHDLDVYNEEISKSLHYTSEETCNVQTITENSSDRTITSSCSIPKQSLEESMEALYKKLEKIERSNEIQIRKNIERKEQTDKSIKKIKEALKLQNRETRRRFERVEKTTNS